MMILLSTACRAMPKHRLSLLVAAFCCLLLSVVSPPAQAASGAGADRVYDALNEQMAVLEERISAGRLGALSIRSLQQSIQGILDQASDTRMISATEASRIKRLLASLGLPPENGDEEDPVVRTERRELTVLLTQNEGRTKRLDLIIARAEQALSDLTQVRQQQFRLYMFNRGPSPLAVASWQVAVPEFMELIYQSYVVAPSRWLSSLDHNPERATKSLQYLIILMIIAATGWPLGRWMMSRYGRRSDIREPSYARRLLGAFVEAAGHGLIPLMFVIGVRILFVNDAMMGYELRIILDVLTRYLAIFLIGYSLIKAVFTPDSSVWRLTPLRTVASRRAVQRLQAVLTIYVVMGAVGHSLTWSTPSDVLESVYGLVFAVTLYPALWALLRRRVWLTIGTAAAGPRKQSTDGPDDDSRASSVFWSRFRAFLALLLFAVPVSAIAGYSRLSGFLIDATMLSGLAIAGFLALRWLVHSGLTELIERQLQRDSGAAGIFSMLLTSDRDSPGRLTFWMHSLINILLLGAALMVLLPLWGLQTDTLLNSLTRLFSGIEIGGYTFSLLDFTFAAVFFAAIMLATRIVQRGMERHFLPKVIRDVGVRDALRTAVGYTGVVIAVLVAISTLGLDLSNLALIAGALSVGLGFGLQNVVSNFVSGLILLAERPIKPGDWIVVNGNEGTVKKVNVRSTEIETFQRASVMIPNADLIANPVTNWTHKNVFGRLEVRIGVAYGSDVDLVHDTLMKIASAHSMVIPDPAPCVIFKDFGASALDFELRCFLRDVGWVVIVGSELRFTIIREFRRLGIEIPFPQHVVHLASGTPQQYQEPSTVVQKPPAKRSYSPQEVGPEPNGDGE